MTLKGARPTRRDSKLLRHLFDYGVISSNQISQWIFPKVEKTTVLRRLRRLEIGGFIRTRGTLPDGTGVFLIGQEGIRFLEESQCRTTYPQHLLAHEIEINSVRWTLSQLGVVKSWMTERTLRSEIMRRNPSRERSNLIIPDALILFRHFLEPNAKVELEMELHAKSDQRYKARFQKFDPMKQSSCAFRWYFVRTTSCGERILHFAEKYGGQGASELIGYTVLPDLHEKDLGTTLHLADRTMTLREVFALSKAEYPAQGGAQGLSRVNIQKQENVAA